MLIKSETQEGLEYICYFLGYIIIADGKIAMQETLLINEFIDANGLGIEIKEELVKILASNSSKISLDEVVLKLSQLPVFIIEQALIAGLLIGYGDGELDEKEEEILLRLVLATRFDKFKYEKLKESAASQGKHLYS
ncbi:MAG: hypothetical protein RML72_03735 [Bacteroidia bacterium]|nr:hypothetical protein [Bacteroidia bacterium]MDW8157973.1 hypothetical protein [Bacteroidia bacterium]